MATTQKTAMNNSVLGILDTLIDEINEHEKQASVKKTAADDGSGSGSYKKDPGSKGGESTHPTAKLDGGNHPASYGAHGAETSKDVKEEVPNCPDSTSTSVNEDGRDHDHVQVGMRASATGEAPEIENAYKGTKDDPGTSTKVNAEHMGEKYSSMAFPALYKEAVAKTELLLTRLAADQTFGSKQASATTTADAAAAGYALADLAAMSPDDPRMAKMAAAHDLVATIQKEAFDDADLAGEYLYKLAAQEQAMMPPEEGPPPTEASLPPEMGGGAAPPPEAAAAGGAPPEGGEGGGGPEEIEAAINEFANAMIEAGVPPEALVQAVAQAAQQHAGGGGAPGGAPPGGPEAGGMGGDPAAPGGEKMGAARVPYEELVSLHKWASAVCDRMQHGGFRRTYPRQGSKQAADRKEAVEYLNYIAEALRA
jgi:hypothetical protein